MTVVTFWRPKCRNRTGRVMSTVPFWRVERAYKFVSELPLSWGYTLANTYGVFEKRKAKCL